ncbi:uncharacterized protein LOC122961513 [Acropora millepora]|uniref:uncharacterized protein LOC122961513 n=1 Tax=Acropora millepora TaxID=45264 RepID=UPI001CF53B3C|nr:uncharacterized protein LOC122961513 [Acropora millepora]
MNKEELVELLAKSQDAILERVDSKLQELKRSISQDQEECLSSVVKRVKEDNSIKWKKVGNEKQFKFNQSVEARFDSAISAIEKKKLDKAKEELEEVLSSAALSVSEDQISQPSDVFDFEKSSDSCLFKVGSLREHVDFWSNSIRASDFIINTIVEGYRIPFFDLPENFAVPNRYSAFKFKDFVFEAISELIQRGCVKEVLNPPKFINPLHVVQQSCGKCRLILDLSYLNRFIWKQSVRFEDIRTVFDLFQSGYFFFTFDLKFGYHHVEIFPDHRQYLGFSWNFGSVVKFFVFSVLPFGFTSTPYIFSKLVRSLVNYWRGLGRRVVTFLDDGIGGSPDYASCLVLSRSCRSDLDFAGFFVNLQKSLWEPSQVGAWLGFHLDFSIDFITVPLPKILKLQENISRILALRFVNAKDLASVAGQLNSMFLAIGNIVRLMSRAMYAQISAQNSWFSNFHLEDSVVEELYFWQSNLDHLNGRRIWFKSSAVRVAYSDASDTGYGGYIVELGPQVAAQGVWSADLAKESSTMREILAVRNVLQSFAPKLAGLCVKWHTDNQNVARIIGVGSRISGLQSEAKRIFEVCVQHGISIEPEWLPRSSNKQADYLSRIVDFDDWFVSPHIFRFLDLKWGPHSIDRFADEHNHLLPRFDSRFWNPYCEAMDTFTRSWDFDNNWVCPPPHLVPRTPRHMRSCCAQDVFSSSMWSDLRAAVPQASSALQSLASSLPDPALASRATSTSSKYFSSYNRWRSWAREHGLTVFPASPFHFAIFLRHLMTGAKTASPLESAVHNITWFHQLGGEQSPSDHPLVKSTLAGAQRVLARQTIKKDS